MGGNLRILWRKFLVRWYYFWGHLISIPMISYDLGSLYTYYHRWMCESCDLDLEKTFWKEVRGNE
jgi:hypothetical protein